jgi:hypothetical protein
MEVHAHSHTERKKWTHYFWEFFMLFLAVFCGFLAENQREHFVEHQREKQYIRSLIQDVKTDTSQMERWLIRYAELHTNCDSVLISFPTSPTVSDMWFRNIFSLLRGFPDFIYTDQTMQQLKNAGGLRLIRNKPAIDSIIAYDAAVRDILIEETVNDDYFGQLTNLTNNQFSYQKINDSARSFRLQSNEKNYWIRYDPVEMEKLYNRVYKYRDEIKDFIEYLKSLKMRGSGLILFLKKEYHLK